MRDEELAHASHLPALRVLANWLEPRSVLELGAGLYSTGFFLSLAELERLRSLETDPYWYRRVAERFADERLELELVGRVAESLPPLGEFDFIFCDDSRSAEERSRTIRALLTREHPPVAIHDAEIYAPVIEELVGEDWALLGGTPDTAVVW